MREIEKILDLPSEDIVDVKREIITSPRIEHPIVKEEPDQELADIQDDVNEARENIKNLITIGTNAAEHLAQIASEKEDSKSFEALATMIKTVVSSSEALIDIQKKKIEAKSKKQGATNLNQTNQTINVNNAVFAGTTKDLIGSLKKNGN